MMTARQLPAGKAVGVVTTSAQENAFTALQKMARAEGRNSKSAYGTRESIPSRALFCQRKKSRLLTRLSPFRSSA